MKHIDGFFIRCVNQYIYILLNVCVVQKWGEKMYTVSFGMTNNTFFVVGEHISKEEALTVLLNQGFVSDGEVKGVKHCHQIDVVDNELLRTPATMVELTDSLNAR